MTRRYHRPTDEELQSFWDANADLERVDTLRWWLGTGVIAVMLLVVLVWSFTS